MERFSNKRVCAFLIDVIFVGFVNFWNYRFFLSRLPLSFPSTPLIPDAILVIYFLLRDGLFRGRSIGKWMVGLQVVDLEGKRCTFKKSFGRNIFLIIPVIGIVIEYFVMAYSKDGRRLGDRLAKTKVIDSRPKIKDGWFLLLSLVLFFGFGLVEPLHRFNATEKEAKEIVVLLEDYKEKQGVYPKKLDELAVKPRHNFVYTRYRGYKGTSEFFLTGIAAPHPRKISYSSELKEWKIHRESGAWTEEELSRRIGPKREEKPEESQRGKKYTLILKNGQTVTGKAVEKDVQGLWLEIYEGARAYFTNEEILRIIESK